MESEKADFFQTTSEMEHNVSDYDSDKEFLIKDMVNEKFGKIITQPRKRLNLRWNLLRRNQDLARIFSDTSSSDDGSSFSGTSLEKRFSSESNSSNSDTNDEVVIEQQKMTRSLEKVQGKMFQMDRVRDYLYNDTVNTTSVSMLLSKEDLRLVENEEENKNAWFSKREFLSSSLLENIVEEPLSFVDERDNLAMVGEVTINRVSFKSVKRNSKNNFILIVHHGKTTHVFSLPKNTKFEKNGTIHFLDPIKLDLVNGSDVTLQLGCAKTHEKDVMRQLKSYFKSIKKFIGRREEAYCYTNPKKYFKSIGLCKFDILNLQSENVLEFSKNGKNIVHPLFEIDMTDNNIQFAGVTTGYLDVVTKVNTSYRWEKFWCVLDGYNFKYYDDELEDELRGSIRLWKNENFNNNENTFVRNHEYTIIDQFLAANSDEAFIKWQGSLNLALSGQKCWDNAKDELTSINHSVSFNHNACLTDIRK